MADFKGTLFRGSPAQVSACRSQNGFSEQLKFSSAWQADLAALLARESWACGMPTGGCHAHTALRVGMRCSLLATVRNPFYNPPRLAAPRRETLPPAEPSGDVQCSPPVPRSLFSVPCSLF